MDKTHQLEELVIRSIAALRAWV